MLNHISIDVQDFEKERGLYKQPSLHSHTDSFIKVMAPYSPAPNP